MLPFTITYSASPVRRPAIFMHIQKTAGTTITEAVRRHYRSDFVSHGDYLKPEEDPVYLGTLWFRVLPAVHGRSLLIYISQRSCRANTFALLFLSNSRF